MRSWSRVALGAVIVVAGCTGPGAATSPVGAPAGTVPADRAGGGDGCGSPIATDALPDWADAGFRGDARVPHVFGAGGEIVAVLFGNPLRVTRVDGSANKILWVARTESTPADATASTDLTITATLDGSDTRVTREVAGGPGPSIVDLPRAGCWHLDLRWSGGQDTMDLVYGER